jgi:hypothetical protein
MRRLEEEGLLDRAPAPLHVGQGFQGVAGDGYGIGACARGFRLHLDGCPPSAAGILEFLRKHA